VLFDEELEFELELLLLVLDDSDFVFVAAVVEAGVVGFSSTFFSSSLLNSLPKNPLVGSFLTSAGLAPGLAVRVPSSSSKCCST
jgi:hypothetical protein